MTHHWPLSFWGREGGAPKVVSPETGLQRQSGTVAQGDLPDMPVIGDRRAFFPVSSHDDSFVLHPACGGHAPSRKSA